MFDIHVWRRAIQIAIAGFFILLPLLNDSGFSFIWGNFLNIHIGSLTFSDPLAVAQVIIKSRYTPMGLLIGAGLVLGIAFFLGTIFCSWVCPFGLLSELINRLACRFRLKKIINVIFRTNALAVKVVIFCAVFLASIIFFSSPVLNQISLPFQYSNIFQYLFVQKHLFGAIWFIGAILALEFVLSTRVWCRFICPQSVLLTIASLFNPFRLKIVFKDKNCISDTVLPPCQRACSLDLDPRHLSFMNRAQCTNCGDCVDACRKTGKALGFSLTDLASIPV
ncbi:MAG: 4Fe-4S binding protein [Desulfobacteraceae bacterium]|nr:4Fe-4S binding protein [Desulfobacteraceae bacterium]